MTAAAILSLYAFTAASAEEVRMIGWESRNNGLEDLPIQIAQLYISLYNAAKLPITSIVDEQGKDVQTLLRERRLHFGKFFPMEMDALMCELNSAQGNALVATELSKSICDRPRPLAPPEVVTDMSAHIGGRLPTLPRWRNAAGDTIVLPNVNFHETYELVQYEKKKGQRVEDIVMARAGCETFDEKCRSFLDRLNRRQPNYADVAFEGDIEIPVLALTAVIDVSCPPGACAGGFDVETAAAITTEAGWPEPVTDSEAPVKAVDLVPKTEDAFKVLNSRLWGGIAPDKFGLKTEHLFSFQKDLFEFIDYPWVDDDVPEEYKKQLTIAVIDGPANVGHCDLADEERVTARDVTIEATPGEVVIVAADQPPPANATGAMPIALPRNEPDAPNTSDTCEDKIPVGGTLQDHATHVLGIIGAHWNGSGIAGLNPYAKLRLLVADDEKLKDKRYQQALANEIVTLFANEELRVVNVSWGWPPIQEDSDAADGESQPARTLIESIIGRLQDHVLFVAAAGQNRNGGPGRDLSSYCSVYPACLTMPNVLGVVALEGDSKAPKPPLWANVGRDLGIGALGTDVVSSGSQGNFVLLNGSSMAAPQVSAIASLLFAKVTTVTPLQVKNRLLACALPARQLEGKIWSGRLDASCTLGDPKLDRLVLKNPAEVLKGRLVGGRLNGKVESNLRLLDEESGNGFLVPWRRIYALRADPSTLDSLILFRLARPDEPHQSPLIRDPRLVVAPEASGVDIIFRSAGGGGEQQIPISRLVTFIAAIE